MGWQPDGTVTRTNGEYTGQNGSLWQQDLAADIKIVASRHDIQDQDLADAIAATLNLDGYNALRANLKMATYKIVNIGAATDLTDVPQYGQIAGDLAFDEGTRVLTLNNRAGDPIDTVVVPGSGTGGDGTVQEISNDGTLNFSVDPITTTGTIGLETLTPGQTTSNGIASITIDDYGRVTQVVGGAFDTTGDPDQTISQTIFQNAVGINITRTGASSQGFNIQSASASLLRAGVMSATQVQKLDDLVNAGLTVSQPTTSVSVNAADGSSAQIGLAEPGTGIIGRAGVISNVEKQKLDGVMRSAPSGASSAGFEGDTAYDDDFFYVCVSNNSWKRVAIAAW